MNIASEQPIMAGAFTATAQIVANLCNQIVALQATITGRKPESQFPTPEETNLFCKLVNCLDKLTKIAARMAPSEQQPTVPPKPSGNGSNGKMNMAPAAQEPVWLHQPDFPTQVPSGTRPMAPEPVCPTEQRYSEPVITLEEWQDNRELIARPWLEATMRDSKKTIPWRGIPTNIAWLQYNLFQWELPLPDRKFFPDETRYHDTFDHLKICRQIIRHCW